MRICEQSSKRYKTLSDTDPSMNIWFRAWIDCMNNNPTKNCVQRILIKPTYSIFEPMVCNKDCWYVLNTKCIHNHMNHYRIYLCYCLLQKSLHLVIVFIFKDCVIMTVQDNIPISESLADPGGGGGGFRGLDPPSLGHMNFFKTENANLKAIFFHL